MTKEPRERSFDELAIGMASGTLSRRKALRLMGAALVGGVLASLPGAARAVPEDTPHGNNAFVGACAQYCREKFSGDPDALTECINQGRQFEGPCTECGGPLNPAPSCPEGSVLDPELCFCVCPPGTFRCRNTGDPLLDCCPIA